VDLYVTSLHHRRAVHRWERMSVGDLIERVTWSRPDKPAIVDAELWPKAQEPLAAKGLPTAVTIAIGGPPTSGGIGGVVPPGASRAPGSVTFTELIDGQPITEPDVEIHADDIWEILFTSGTTALPKGVMISHACSYAAGFGFALSLTRGLRLESDLKVGTYLPLIYPRR
jgi:acyl-CoA synthetase (AMP-forming)/AMP-acid ligase II